jgi:hypothetical protein
MYNILAQWYYKRHRSWCFCTAREGQKYIHSVNTSFTILHTYTHAHTYMHITKDLIYLIFHSFHPQVLLYYGFSVVGHGLLSKYRSTAVQCIQHRVILDLDGRDALWGGAKNVKERTCRLLLVPIEKLTLTRDIKKTHFF